MEVYKSHRRGTCRKLGVGLRAKEVIYALDGEAAGDDSDMGHRSLVGKYS